MISEEELEDPFRYSKFVMMESFMSYSGSDDELLHHLKELSDFVDDIIINFEDALDAEERGKRRTTG